MDGEGHHSFDQPHSSYCPKWVWSDEKAGEVKMELIYHVLEAKFKDLPISKITMYKMEINVAEK